LEGLQETVLLQAEVREEDLSSSKHHGSINHYTAVWKYTYVLGEE